MDPEKLHSDADIWHALERVHLKDKISAVAAQLHYTIDAKIFSISEKQRLFLAKAFLCQNKVPYYKKKSYALIIFKYSNTFSIVVYRYY